MLVDFAASEPQYLSHLTPLWHGLPLSERGAFYVRHTIAAVAAAEGVTSVEMGRMPPSINLTVVAGYSDSELARQTGRPVAFLEHGSGQSYVGPESVRDHPSYSGGVGHDHARLFLCPSERVADRWRTRYPLTTATAIGCPKLDGLHRAGRVPPSGPPVAVVSFHSDLGLVAETRSALPHYERGLADVASRLRASGITLVGHSHPRLWRRAKLAYERAGIEAIEDFGGVLARASVYVCDNSSTLFEAASVGIPVVALNAPWFRRDVHHGLRFWDCVPGLQCDGPEDLAAAITLALEDPPSVREARERIVHEVYAYTDGRASERAVVAILTAADRLALTS